LAEARQEIARLTRRVADEERRRAEAMEQQTATADVLWAAASSPSALPAVLSVLAGRTARLCDARNVVVWRVEGEHLRTEHVMGPELEAVPLHERRTESRLIPGGALTTALESRRSVHLRDVEGEDGRRYPGASDRLRRMGIRTAVWVPVLREGQPVGLIGVYRAEAGPYTDQQLALVEAFADQAAIALENARLFAELQERLEQQTATAGVLEVISRAPADLPRVLQAICASAGRLCGAWTAIVSRVEGSSIRREAWWLSPERAADLSGAGPPLGEVVPLERTGSRGLAVRERRTQYVPNLRALPADDPRLGSGAALRGGARAYAAVPLLRGEEALGVLSVAAPEPDALTAQQLRLLEVFADQAVIALENARLFAELQHRNRDLTEALSTFTRRSRVWPQ
jgi:GAF domain-containing protein